MLYFKYNWSVEQIKSEYRRLSMLFHNDKGGEDEKFIELKQEYEDMLAIKRRWNELSRLLKRPVIVKPTPAPKPKEQVTFNDIERWVSIGIEGAKTLDTLINGVSTLMDRFEVGDDEEEQEQGENE